MAGVTAVQVEKKGSAVAGCRVDRSSQTPKVVRATARREGGSPASFYAVWRSLGGERRDTRETRQTRESPTQPLDQDRSPPGLPPRPPRPLR